jgi:hypothetical protein
MIFGERRMDLCMNKWMEGGGGQWKAGKNK